MYTGLVIFPWGPQWGLKKGPWDLKPLSDIIYVSEYWADFRICNI